MDGSRLIARVKQPESQSNSYQEKDKIKRIKKDSITKSMKYFQEDIFHNLETMC